MRNKEPLAYRMRPQRIEDIVGQEDIIGQDTKLYQMIQNGYVPSMLLYGEPGIGKTAIAYAVAGTVNLPFSSLNATTAGKKDVEIVIEKAKMEGTTILFLDEIHRFNKAQQDYLLPHVEKGLVILIGATTENPYHDVNPAIRSRCGQIKQLSRLSSEDIIKLLRNAIDNEERGLGTLPIQKNEEVLRLISEGTNGDARKALNVLEAVVHASRKTDGKILLEEATVHEFIDKAGVFGDKKGSNFYNLLSSLQKSIRGSDVDASLYYLAHLLESGDLTAVNRRLLVIAYEDIGLSNHSIGPSVLAAVEASERLGMPEARIPLAVAVVDMCLSSKSNSAYKALDTAINDIRKGKTGSIPLHLRDGHYKGAEDLGHVGYKYPHNYPLGSFGGWVKQDYLPENLKERQYYKPVEAGEEKRMSEIYKKLRKFKQQ
ncbi:replication-associated recombination protein A [Sediminibacillus massiliensis]|uniref:replication-associated recombination protein A n=1 Tax=Sediminibacillus massiliensis TaxID=1926277 RepID=UPI0009887A3A|nr:replication-associated recombination protein A [Sediminibacillus massiliensis]